MGQDGGFEVAALIAKSVCKFRKLNKLKNYK
jgi:hypothetical protein